MTQTTPITLEIPQNLGGLRLDQALQKLLPDQSRSRLQAWIKEGLVTIDDKATTSKLKVWGGERVQIVPQESPQANAFKAEDIALDIVYEDDHLLVINKPAGMVVHPAAGNWEGTLLNALLYYLPQLKELPRAGIVHRLDKDTSGLLVVAKTIAAQNSLVKQLQARTVKREYRAIVWGNIWRNGKVDQPIGRHPHNRTKMAVSKMGKPSVTHYEVLERFAVHTYVRCMLETGRTHQIRVHMQYLKAPLVGDPVYGLRGIVPHRAMTQTLIDALAGFKRQALHAIKLGLIHPETGEPMHWQIELPADMKALLEAMRAEDIPESDEELLFDYVDDEDSEEGEFEEIEEEDDVE
ncbi:MAG: 23S rRNA pseudouridine(1911/1915/1917) synthase RluD [Betaproteobacteria bacterium HGW-Betaproteobacteria-2]|nr:MAG: 23S rRNA pseudouridine(1911/1915/1917) synthase RluD [Betaproteobacteria bacterium HGW-Betaproteobacteria-2]